MSTTSKTNPSTINASAAEDTKSVLTAEERVRISTEVSRLTALRATAQETALSADAFEIPDFLRRTK